MIDLDEVRRKWLIQCGPCEFGVFGPCQCPQGDPRSVIDYLCDEIEALRVAVAEAEAEHSRFVLGLMSMKPSTGEHSGWPR